MNEIDGITKTPKSTQFFKLSWKAFLTWSLPWESIHGLEMTKMSSLLTPLFLIPRPISSSVLEIAAVTGNYLANIFTCIKFGHESNFFHTRSHSILIARKMQIECIFTKSLQVCIVVDTVWLSSRTSFWFELELEFQDTAGSKIGCIWWTVFLENSQYYLAKLAVSSRI